MFETRKVENYPSIPDDISLTKASLPQSIEAALGEVMIRFDCTVCTLHLLDVTGKVLELKAHCGLPEALKSLVAFVPVGKGIAGVAAERGEPVEICNLQSDDSGVVRPAAKTTGARGSIAVPVIVDGTVRGVLGVGKDKEYIFTAEERDLLLATAKDIWKKFDGGAPAIHMPSVGE